MHCEALEPRRLLAVVTVDTTADTIDLTDGKTSLREAIFATNTVPGADEIRFDFGHDGPATILLSQGELAVTDALTIIGPGAELLAIDASGNDPTPFANEGNGSRVFRISDGNTSRLSVVTITGVRLERGDVKDNGGGIYNEEQLALHACAVAFCSASQNGGGVYSVSSTGGGTLQVVSSVIADNWAGSSGGGIYNVGGSVELEGANIRDNFTTRSGGGVHVERSSLIITGGAIERNAAIGDDPQGGGLYINNTHAETNGQVSIVDVEFDGNSAINDASDAGLGGAIFCAGAGVENLTSFVIATSRIIQNRSGFAGGGIYSANASLHVNNTTLNGNTAISTATGRGRGGGLMISGGSVAIDRCTIAWNAASSSGGGVFFVGQGRGDATITSSRLIGNQALNGNGGAIHTWNSSHLSLRDSELSHTRANSSGGGISVEGTTTIENSVLAHNSATHWSGGLFISASGVVAMNRCVVTGNTARSDGGGIHGNGRLTLSSSIVTSNAALAGGGIRFDGGSHNSHVEATTISGNFARFGGGVSANAFVTFVNSTISGNTGGGLGNHNGQFIIRHCTIANNTGGYGGLAGNRAMLDHTIVANNRDEKGAPVDVYGTATARFSLIGSAQGSSLAEASIGVPDDNGNLIGGPMHGVIDPGLGPLTDHGGPSLPGGAKMLTHALLTGSPAVDAGDPAAIAGAGGVPEFDQRGAPFSRQARSRIDIGALEAQPREGTLQADFDGDGRTSGADFLIWQRNLGRTTGATRREGDATADGDVDVHDLAVWRATFGTVYIVTPTAQSETRGVLAEPVAVVAVAPTRGLAIARDAAPSIAHVALSSANASRLPWQGAARSLRLADPAASAHRPVVLSVADGGVRRDDAVSELAASFDALAWEEDRRDPELIAGESLWTSDVDDALSSFVV